MIRPAASKRIVWWTVCLGGCLLASVLVAQDLPQKKVLKHSDYEIWNTAGGFKLAPDGQTFAYVLTPPEGDAAVVIRTLKSGKEIRIPTTGKGMAPEGLPPAPPLPPAAPGVEPPATPGPTGGLTGVPTFSPDSKRLVFPLGPTKAVTENAKAAKAKPGEMPKPVLAIYDVASGEVVSRVEKLRGFAVVGEGAGYLLMHNELKVEEPAKPADAKEPKPGEKSASALGALAGAALTVPPAARRELGSDLIVRNWADGTEVTFAEVASYTATKDGKQLLLTVAAKTPENSGLFVATLGKGAELATIKKGAGRITSLTWNQEQTKLAFFQSEAPPAPPAGSPATAGAPPVPPAPVKSQVYLWSRGSKSDFACEILPSSPPGLKAGWSIVDRGGLAFSLDGLKLGLSVAPTPTPTVPKNELAPVPAPAPTAGAPPTPRPGPGRGFGPRAAAAPPASEDRVELDIWHWKDEAIQPMQKVRSAQDRLKSYRAVYLLDTKEFRQLGTEDTEVTVPNYGDWAIASSDKAYRAQLWRSPMPRDYALLNVRTGEGKPLLQAHEGALVSAYGDYVVAFNGKDWVSHPVPDGKPVNLTAKLGVKFFNEEFDTPMQAPAYGIRGFTADRKHVVLADQFDLWKVAVDGGGAVNLTQIGSTLKTTFSVVSLNEDDNSFKLDLQKPLLLAAVNDETQDTGFYRLEAGGKPKLLTLAPRKFGTPTKAKKSDALVFTASTYFDYPDYYVADGDFREIKKVTELQPRKSEFNWGKSELVPYKSADGLALKGLLIKPEDFDANKKYPMIVYIYERLTDNVHQYRAPTAGTSINPTYYASNGYLVYMPDIAYTTGSPGQSALKCVLPGIQSVVEKGYVNEAAIGIQGHSWGGYQIAYLVTQTKLFRAACAGAPVSNMVSAYGGIRWGTGLPRQFQYERTQSRIGATLWQAPMRYIENSPIFMADRVQTPLLMLHNDQDDAVPWYQGIEYYLALRRLDKEVYLFNYNGELHGLRKKANQRDYTMRMQQFFDHHLKGAPMPDWMAKGVLYNDRDKEKEQWKKLFSPEKPPEKPSEKGEAKGSP